MLSPIDRSSRNAPFRRVRLWYRRNRAQFRRFVYHHFLHADDPPHPLALGMAVGVFVALTPTIGVQMVLAGFLSWLVRANKAISVAIVWVSNPGTAVPIYWYCYRIGCAVLAAQPIGKSWWDQMTHPPLGWWPRVTFYWSRFTEVAAPLWVGSLVVGAIAAYISYYAVYQAIVFYRRRN